MEENNPDLKRLHNIFAAQTHGCLLRNELAWEEYWRWDVDDTTVALYYDDHDTPTGYMVYLLKDNIMHIKEMIYLDIDAWKGLWKYISAHESMVDEVVGNNYSNESIAFWLEDSDIRETIRPYIMGRIVDVAPVSRTIPVHQLPGRRGTHVPGARPVPRVEQPHLLHPPCGKWSG